MTDSLTFYLVSSNEAIYDPLLISGTETSIMVTNHGDEDLSNLGFYISPASNIGDIDYPANFPPETDYEDLITWGSRTVAGASLAGGLVLTRPTNDGTLTSYITRSAGSTLSSKVSFKDLVAGASETFTIKFETPPSESARRFFVNLHIEQS